MKIVIYCKTLQMSEILMTLFERLSSNSELLFFSDSRKLTEFAQTEKADVFFIQANDDCTQLARSLKKHEHRVNIIFLADDGKYAADAMRLHASGYITKPFTSEKIQAELSDLRYYVRKKNAALLKVRSFGNFEVYLTDGTPVRFERNKSRELFAYLVYRQGASCTIKEIAARIFENEAFDKKKQVYIQKIISVMMKNLKSAGAESVVNKKYNSLSVDTSLIDCDFYNFIREAGICNNKYTGEFMAQYSWAEHMNGYFERISQSKTAAYENS